MLRAAQPFCARFLHGTASYAKNLTLTHNVPKLVSVSDHNGV